MKTQIHYDSVVAYNLCSLLIDYYDKNLYLNDKNEVLDGYDYYEFKQAKTRIKEFNILKSYILDKKKSDNSQLEFYKYMIKKYLYFFFEMDDDND